LFGQVTFIITEIPEYTPPEDVIYIAGSINSWNPGASEFALEKNENENWFITLPEEPDGTTIQFKFTRGDWGTVEKGASGEEITNRQFTFGNGDTVNVEILNWADSGGGGGSTAAENVSIITDNFFMPQLERSRRIWIYLPPDYDNTTKNYPVLYMHDGQNVFDAYTAYAGEWEVDETLNDLAEEGYNVPIVVAIDNGGAERMKEYNPWINPQYGGGLGDEYIDFIVETLKPYIDENYRTFSGREETGIMGSSMGGLISQYGALKYQNVFSKVGIFSPAYWTADSIWMFTTETGKQQNMKIYQIIGSLEGQVVISDMWEMQNELTNVGFGENELLSLEVEGAEHNEAFWRDNFRNAYLWMFTEFANDIAEPAVGVEIEITPNPVISHINISGYKLGSNDSLEIIDITGRKIINQRVYNTKRLDVDMLKPGNYILIIRTKNITYQGKFIKK
jgi:predicted alpha/beta superfamily hydrolase